MVHLSATCLGNSNPGFRASRNWSVFLLSSLHTSLDCFLFFSIVANVLLSFCLEPRSEFLFSLFLFILFCLSLCVCSGDVLLSKEVVDYFSNIVEHHPRGTDAWFELGEEDLLPPRLKSGMISLLQCSLLNNLTICSSP